MTEQICGTCVYQPECSSLSQTDGGEPLEDSDSCGEWKTGWQTDPPTEPGYWWIHRKGEKEAIIAQVLWAKGYGGRADYLYVRTVIANDGERALTDPSVRKAILAWLPAGIVRPELPNV